MQKQEFNIKEEYQKLKDKYSLPEFEILNKEFELSFIENKEFLLRSIRRRLRDKVIFFCKILENILFQTTQNQASIYESTFFDEIKKQELSELYKKLMILDRQAMLIDVNPEDSKEVEYINILVKEWPQFKEKLDEVALTMKNSWFKEIEEQKHKYFG